MVVQHNIPSLNAHRNLLVNNSSTAKNLEKLSSGFRINRAGDDAAGLAISEKMRAQIRGLAMAEQNANNGISLIQTAEGGLNETHAILQRMRELAVQASNGTYQDEDRKQIALEVEALKSEINRIASATNYNKINLLDGTTGGKMINEPVAAGGATGSPFSMKMDAANLTDIESFLTGLGVTGIAAGDFAKMQACVDVSGTNLSIIVSGGEVKLTDGTDDLTWDASKAAVTNFKLTGGTNEYDINADMQKVLNALVNAAAADKTLSLEFNVDIAQDTTNTPQALGTFNSGSYDVVGKDTYTGSASDLANLIAGLDGDAVVNFTGSSNETNFKGQSVTFTVVDGEIYAEFGGNVEKGVRTATEITFTFSAADIFELVVDGTKISNTENGSFTVAFNGSVAATGDTIGGSTGNNVLSGVATSVAPLGGGSAGPVSQAVLDLFAEMGLDETAELSFEQALLDTLNGDVEAYIITRDDGAGSKELVLQVGDKGYVLDGNDFKDAQGNTVASFDKAAYTPNVDADGVIRFTIAGNTQANTGIALQDISGMIAATSSQVTFQIGANGTADQRVGLHINNMSTFFIGDVAKGNYVADIDISSIEGANAAIDVVNEAIMQVSAQRANLGALQNRLEHTVQNLSVTRENLTAAESTIRDVDMAKEMMEFTKNSILVQASQAMLAQANALPQGILSLLR